MLYVNCMLYLYVVCWFKYVELCGVNIVAIIYNVPALWITITIINYISFRGLLSKQEAV